MIKIMKWSLNTSRLTLNGMHPSSRGGVDPDFEGMYLCSQGVDPSFQEEPYQGPRAESEFVVRNSVDVDQPPIGRSGDQER